MLDERNELLAKLMATENIEVRQMPVPTAYFDVQKRRLVLPNWKNLSEIETEMMIGHEIGHALYTPTDAWVAAIDSFGGNKQVFKHVLNVIEDPRIERGVKKKYPGMRKIFYFGYEELWERGIFEDLPDPKDLTLIDKLNLHFKVPGKVNFEVDKRFWDLVEKINNCENFSSVVDLAKEIYQHCEEEDAQQESLKSKSSSESTSDEGSQTKSGQDSESDSELESIRPGPSDGNPGNSKPTEVGSDSGFQERYTSKVQKKMEEFLKQNVSSDSVKYAYLHEPILKNILITNKEFLKYLSDASPTENSDVQEDIDVSEISPSMKKFNKEYSSSIAYYTKVFEMKKKAKEYKQTLNFKTGKLNMNVLSKYKFEDNLFLTTQVKQKGKNHGLVFYLDMSSSMHPVFKQVIAQLLEIISFCRNVNIPVSVYGFTNGYNPVNFLYARAGKKYDIYSPARDLDFQQFQSIDNQEPYPGSSFALIEFFSPSMSRTDFIRIFNLFLSGEYSKYDWFFLHQTPLAPAINTVEAIVNRFRKETRAEIVNVVFLTDGGDNHGLSHYSGVVKNRNGYILDPKTKNKVSSFYIQEKFRGGIMGGHLSYMIPAALLNLVKKRMKDVSFVNFFIHSYPSYVVGNVSYEVEKKQTMEFDELYYVRKTAFDKINTKIYGTDIEDIQDNFITINNAKKQKRTMVDSFIQKIC